jgi:hypothetical protein
MKRNNLIYLFFICLVSFFYLTGCAPGERSDKKSQTEKTSASKTIIPQAKQNVMRYAALNGGDGSLVDPMSEDQEPKIMLPENETFIQLLNTNLDLDVSTEQIIAVKNNRDPGNSIKIDVVDYDEIRNDYYLVWSDYIQAINPTTLHMEVDDLTGDFNFEIICRGMNSEGELTLDVFRKAGSSTGLGLAYYSIIQIRANNRIDIEKEKRTEAYQLRQSLGSSFPIVVERNDPASASGFDVIRETYYWKYEEKKYIKTTVEMIPGNQIAQKQLKDLFAQGAPDKEYYKFLRGAWCLQEQADILVVFSPEENCISFFNKNIIENYNIINLSRFGYRFYINAQSTVIQSIQKFIEVSIKSLNSVEIIIKESESWSGSYDRILEQASVDFFKQGAKSTTESQKISLSGVYKNHEGLEIAFEQAPPFFTWLEGGVSQGAGGYSILYKANLLNALFLEREISKNVAVITFRFQKDNGLFIKDNCYILEYAEKQENNTRNRTLTLTPAQLLVKGVEAVDRKSLQLEQTEIIDQEKVESNKHTKKL